MTICHSLRLHRSAINSQLCHGLKLFAVTAFLPVAAAAAGHDAVPEGLSATEWSSIRATYEANRHAVLLIDDCYQARNPGQRWRTRFDGRGFLTTPDAGDWSWGLDLVGYGREGAERTVEVPRCTETNGGRVHIMNGTSCSRSGMSTTGAAVVHYQGLTVFDADRATVPAWFERAGAGLRLNVDDSAARYPLTIDPLAHQAYLKASNTGPADELGLSIAVSGNTVVVGAQFEDSDGTGVDGVQDNDNAGSSGAAYVFVRDGSGNWSQQAYLKASNAEGDDQFAVSVAASGDTVVVGAWFEGSNATGVNGNQADNNAGGAGAAYVFVRDGAGNWSQQAYLKRRTPRRATNSASRCRCRATRWWSARISKTATPPA